MSSLFPEKIVKILTLAGILSVSAIWGQQQGSVADVKDLLVKGKTGDKSTVLVETQYHKFTIAARGAEIVSLKHKDEGNNLKNNSELVSEDYLSLQFYTNEKSLVALRNVNFTLREVREKDYTIVFATTEVVLLTDREKIPARITKKFIFYKALHFWSYTWTMENLSGKSLNLPYLLMDTMPKLGPKDIAGGTNSYKEYHFYHTPEKFEIIQDLGGSSFPGCSKRDPEKKEVQGKVEFFGASSRFLVVAMQPLFDSKGLIIFPENKATTAIQQLHLNVGSTGLPANGKVQFEFVNYAGPKVKDYLTVNSANWELFPATRKLHVNIYKGFDFGITEPIRDLIVFILNILYKLIPNYGVGIILFAILFKLLFFPLNQKQAEAMKKMADIQPEMKVINEKYKDNPQEKQKRILELYKKYKVNPVSGCLPMLIQIPIFIALYSAFSDSYDLWKSPFISSWIPDLSSPDVVFRLPAGTPVIGAFSVHLLPILMTLTQYWQTKMTTVSGDDTQRKIMLLMPFMMLFLFYSMPSGVVMYWTVQNLLSIGQQLYTNAKGKKTEIK